MAQPSSLPEYQKLISELVVERGFDQETVSEVFMLLVEEVGELGKAIRQQSGVKTGSHSKQHAIEDEAADVFWLLVDLCNRLDIDLQQAFQQKEAKHQKRVWG